MHERRHRYTRAVGLGLALAVALGLLLMHGLDAHATANGHGLTTAPSALIADVSPALTSSDQPPATLEREPGHSMASICLAVLVAGLVLLAVVLSIGSVRSARAHQACSAWVGAVVAPGSRRAPPSLPRIALCVSLC